MLLESVLVGLDGERAHQPEATLAIGKVAHHMDAAFDLLSLGYFPTIWRARRPDRAAPRGDRAGRKASAAPASSHRRRDAARSRARSAENAHSSADVGGFVFDDRLWRRKAPHRVGIARQRDHARAVGQGAARFIVFLELLDRLEPFEKSDDLAKQLARLPQARRHEQDQTGTPSGLRRLEPGGLAPQRFGRPSIPARTRKSSDHFACVFCTNKALCFQSSNSRQISCAVMSGAEGPADARRAAPQCRP
jgi:hypothetical protein